MCAQCWFLVLSVLHVRLVHLGGASRVLQTADEGAGSGGKRVQTTSDLKAGFENKAVKRAGQTTATEVPS